MKVGNNIFVSPGIIYNTQFGTVTKTIPLSNTVYSSEYCEIVDGLESQKVELSIKGEYGKIPAKAGFLIEVYLSLSDGQAIVKMPENDVIEPGTGKLVQEGYGKYLTIKVDQQ